jgi:uncharacterized repeat protein (TIGR01451 family)
MRSPLRFTPALLAFVLPLLRAPEAQAAGLAANGPPVLVYKPGFNGTQSPATETEPSLFNALAIVFGAATPPAGALVSAASTFGGNPTTYLDITAAANQVSGTAIVSPCTDFGYTNANGCVAIAGSTPTSVIEVVMAQSWPFYVGTAPSSNVNPGTFAFQTSTDDGSWLVLAQASFTYAQPGNFGGATGLAAGTAVVANGSVHSNTAVSGSATIAASASCASNLYWLTFEYYEAVGGQAGFEYSWRPPGSAALGQVTQAALYGQVTYNGAPLAGATVSIPLPAGGSASVTSDSNGCYGYNFTPTWTGTATIGAVSATSAALGVTKTSAATQVTEGASTVVNFAVNPPSLTMYKRITQIARAGTIITVPNDPSNPAGVLGSSNYPSRPGDQLTYTIYYSNSGDVKAVATGAPTAGPQITDTLNSPLVAVSASMTCANPPSGNPAGSAPVISGSTITWSLTSPLPANTAGGIQGCVSLVADVP